MRGGKNGGNGSSYFENEFFVKKILPICVCQVVSVGCTNIALLYIYPSFMVMLESTQPLFTLGCGALLGTEAFHQGYSMIAMAMILLGALLSTEREANFHPFGFILIMLAVAARALKSAMEAKVLRASGRVNSLTLLYYVMPQSFVAFFIWSLVSNGTEPLTALMHMPFRTWILILFSAILACCFNIVGFLALRILNATTASLLGQMVSPLVAVVSCLAFGNAVAPSQIICFALSGAGVLLYQTKGKLEEVFDEDEEKALNMDL